MAKINKEDIVDVLPRRVKKEWAGMWLSDTGPTTVRTELTGMLPGAIGRIGELLEKVADRDPRVLRGYDSTAAKDSYFYWGAACRIQCDGMKALSAAAKKLGFLWISDDGDLAYTNGLTIDDFMTYRVNGDLELAPENKEV